MKKKNIFKTVIVSSVFFLGLGMNSCIEQTFPESSTATADQVASRYAGYDECNRRIYQHV